MQLEVVLALLAKEPSYGYELRGRIERSLGPLAGGFNAGQMYVTLRRMEEAGLVTTVATQTESDRGDRKVYDVTAQGRERLADWLEDVSWPRPDLADFHLKLVVAAAGHLADPVAIVDSHRRELIRRLAEAQRAALDEPQGSDTVLLLEGMVLRMQADIAWLDVCETAWRVAR